MAFFWEGWGLGVRGLFLTFVIIGGWVGRGGFGGGNKPLSGHTPVSESLGPAPAVPGCGLSQEPAPRADTSEGAQCPLGVRDATGPGPALQEPAVLRGNGGDFRSLVSQRRVLTKTEERRAAGGRAEGRLQGTEQAPHACAQEPPLYGQLHIYCDGARGRRRWGADRTLGRLGEQGELLEAGKLRGG